MKLLDLLITAIALSMDAFAVSIGKGLSVKRLKASHCLITGAYFGGFQALMPLLGFLLASSFASYIQKFDHWIACVLLVLIGANMLREAFSKEEEQGNDSFSFRVMLPLAIATSIDALATGVTFAMMGVNIWIAIAITGLTTFVFSVAGVKIGNLFGSRYQSKAELVGGLILIAMGFKILVEHLLGKA
ncbi:manganese efflux pump MntP family protein [Faecousia intestinalis]|jgi:putative Mn2+ efflux pump MntP|uniref:Putative manganese efflux pump MntP n=1 Tax=Faecousia intestinalis TaxID=3133167 RepID=A0ABV1G705_9FIRM|nr:manganese efflux pump MntP family protein [Oscillospiraceae bacterium]HCS34665.1 hypothetical protein [Clostridiales bacterium]